MSISIDTTLTPSGFADIGALGELVTKYLDFDLTPCMRQPAEEYGAPVAANSDAERAYDAVVARPNELENDLRALEAQDDDSMSSDCAALLAGQNVDLSAYALRRAKIAVMLTVVERAREIAIPDAVAGKLRGGMNLLYASAIASAWACVSAGVIRDKALTAAADVVEESSRRRSRFRNQADQDSGGKPITYSGAKPISDSRLEATSNRPRAEW